MPEYQIKGVSLEKWLACVGRSYSTGYRWVAAKMLNTTNINGKHYVTEEQDREFWKRASAGEFSKDVPSVNEKTERHFQEMVGGD